jgi:hypothetical protein
VAVSSINCVVGLGTEWIAFGSCSNGKVKMGCAEAGNVQNTEETASWTLKSMWGLLSIKFPKIVVVVCFAFFAF